MRKELVINISDLMEFSNNSEELSILDVSGSLKANNKIIPSDFYDETIIQPLMLKKYRSFSEDMLNVKKILDIKINALSVYWLSACGVKYHSLHWAKDFFLLLTILEECKTKIEQNYSSLTLLLPSTIKSFKSVVEQFLKQQKYTIKTQLVFDNQATYVPSIGAIIKGVFTQLKTIKQLKSTSENINNAIYLNGNRPTETHFIKAVEQLFNENNKSITPLTYYWKTNSFPTSFLKHKPTFFQQLKLIEQLIRAYYNINKLPLSIVSVNNQFQLPTLFLKNELKLTLRKNIHLFIYQQWLNNYFSSLKQPTAVFFEDEFYEIGRVVSFAASKSANATTYGLQHAHFMEMHTVYSIYDEELKNGLPIPNHFITWGEAYNQLFLQNNSLPKSYTKALGNPIYTQQDTAINFPSIIQNVLWCLTTNECMDIEWNCIKNTITQPNFKLNIRLHPLKHISEEEVTHKLQGVHFTFQNEGNIQQAIAQNDLIISSAHSTTFLDTLVAKKYGIRITSRFWNGNFNTDNEVLKTIKNQEEFNFALQLLQNNINTTTKPETNNALLQLSNEMWSIFLK